MYLLRSLRVQHIIIEVRVPPFSNSMKLSVRSILVAFLGLFLQSVQRNGKYEE
jgi:hypothetical protein